MEQRPSSPRSRRPLRECGGSCRRRVPPLPECQSCRVASLEKIGAATTEPKLALPAQWFPTTSISSARGPLRMKSSMRATGSGVTTRNFSDAGEELLEEDSSLHTGQIAPQTKMFTEAERDVTGRVASYVENAEGRGSDVDLGWPASSKGLLNLRDHSAGRPSRAWLRSEAWLGAVRIGASSPPLPWVRAPVVRG